MVRSRSYHTPLLERFNGSYIPEPNSGCWLWDASYHVTRDGAIYGEIEAGRKRFRAHRVAYELFVGPIPPGAFICHKCDVSLCVNPHHLYAGTAKSNSDDRKTRARNVGIYSRAKLTEQQVREIFADAAPRNEVAKRFAINLTTVSDIKNGRRWRHLNLKGAAQ